MKKEKSIVVYETEDVLDELSKLGLDELPNLPFKEQIDNNKWYDVGVGKQTLIFCINRKCKGMSKIEKFHLLIKHENRRGTHLGII